MSPKDKLWFSNTNAHIINVVFLNLPRNTNAHNSNVVFYHQIAEPIYRINIQSYQHCCIHKECSFDVLKIQIQEHVYLGERLNPPPPHSTNNYQYLHTHRFLIFDYTVSAVHMKHVTVNWHSFPYSLAHYSRVEI